MLADWSGYTLSDKKPNATDWTSWFESIGEGPSRIASCDQNSAAGKALYASKHLAVTTKSPHAQYLGRYTWHWQAETMADNCLQGPHLPSCTV